MGILDRMNHCFVEGWPVPSRLPVSLPEERLPGSSWPPKLPESPPPPPAVSRSPTDTGLEPSPSGRSGGTRSLPSCSSVSCPSNVWSERSPRTSRPILGSRALPFMPRGSPLCPRTSSWLGEFEASVLKQHPLIDLVFVCPRDVQVRALATHTPERDHSLRLARCHSLPTGNLSVQLFIKNIFLTTPRRLKIVLSSCTTANIVRKYRIQSSAHLLSA